jgi:hypothetical protein
MKVAGSVMGWIIILVGIIGTLALGGAILLALFGAFVRVWDWAL